MWPEQYGKKRNRKNGRNKQNPQYLGPVFKEDKIVYVEYPEESTDKILGLIRKFS